MGQTAGGFAKGMRFYFWPGEVETIKSSYALDTKSVPAAEVISHLANTYRTTEKTIQHIIDGTYGQLSAKKRASSGTGTKRKDVSVNGLQLAIDNALKEANKVLDGFNKQIQKKIEKVNALKKEQEDILSEIAVIKASPGYTTAYKMVRESENGKLMDMSKIVDTTTPVTANGH